MPILFPFELISASFDSSLNLSPPPPPPLLVVGPLVEKTFLCGFPIKLWKTLSNSIRAPSPWVRPCRKFVSLDVNCYHCAFLFLAKREYILGVREVLSMLQSQHTFKLLRLLLYQVKIRFFCCVFSCLSCFYESLLSPVRLYTIDHRQFCL